MPDRADFLDMFAAAAMDDPHCPARLRQAHLPVPTPENDDDDEDVRRPGSGGGNIDPDDDEDWSDDEEEEDDDGVALPRAMAKRAGWPQQAICVRMICAAFSDALTVAPRT